VRAHSIAVPINLEHGGAVQQSVEHGRGDHGVVEDLPQEAMPRLVVSAIEPLR
jgi:hypothetical protein